MKVIILYKILFILKSNCSAKHINTTKIQEVYVNNIVLE